MKTIIQYKSHSGRTSTNHIIFNDNDVSPKSMASLLLLNEALRELDIDYMRKKYELENYLIERHRYLNNIKKETGDLVCHYCGKSHLDIGYIEQEFLYLNNKNKNLATIDHVVPASTGIDILDTKNWVVACKKCNSRKGNSSYEDFVERMKKNKRRRDAKINRQNKRYTADCI